MYETRFGLKRRPFPATPDDALYYPATGHEAALATLVRAIHVEEGLALLSGPPGTGKTLLGHCLSDRLAAAAAQAPQSSTSDANAGRAVVCAFLPNSHLADRSALYQAILYDLKLPYEDGCEQVLRLRLTDHLLGNCGADQRTILIVDEAQHLSADLLEELRLLGNLEAGGKKAVQVVLLAQPGILQMLAKPELASFRQRLVVRSQVDALGVEEALDYLLHHLRQAGGRPERIIDDAALEVLARGAKGIPRLLNQAGHQALLLADAAGLAMVDAEAALEALAVVGLATDGAEEDDTATDQKTSEAALRLAEPMRLPA
jgi:type II secretory pathway predicted ATPase ExeA